MPFKKGVPRATDAGRKKGGRNIATKTIKELAEPYGEEALAILVHIMRKDKSSVARIAASKEVLDRAYGKAMQPLTTPGAAGVLIEIVRFGPTLDLSPAQEALPGPGDDP